MENETLYYLELPLDEKYRIVNLRIKSDEIILLDGSPFKYLQNKFTMNEIKNHPKLAAFEIFAKEIYAYTEESKDDSLYRFNERERSN